MKMRVAIIEDDAREASRLSGFLTDICREQGMESEMRIFENPLQFLYPYKAEADAVFMDVKMPGMDGMDGAKQLRKVDPDVPLVFVTSLARYAAKGYEVGAVDYILKPVTKEAAETALASVIEKVKRRLGGYITVKSSVGFVRIPLISLLYAEVNLHRVLYHTDFGVIDTRGSMKQTEQILPKECFACCNSSYIVNLRHVRKIETEYVTVGEEKLKISRAKKKAFVCALNAYIGFSGGGKLMNEELYFYLLRIVYMFWQIIASIIFALSLKRRKHFVIRCVSSIAVCLGLSVLLGFLAIQLIYGFYEVFGKYPMLYSIMNLITHIIIFVFVTGGLFVCFEEKPITIIYVSVAAYSLQNIGNMFHFIIGLINPSLQFPSLVSVSAASVCIWLLSYVPLYVAAYFIFARRASDVAEVAEVYSAPTVFLFLVVILSLVIIRSFSTAYSKQNELLSITLNVCNIICCMTVLFVQFLLAKEVLKKHETDTVRHMQEMKLKQYEMTKENIDIINLKCHDLKHQLLVLKGNKSLDEDYLKQLSESIEIYDSAIKTGNEALDVVITDKNLYCVKNKINMTVMADGSQVSFMSPSDIYSLFGNALDNAIEYVMTLPAEKRLVKISVAAQGSLVSISVKNRYEGELKLNKKGELATTKRDDGFHGFGIKSIKSIAQKYGGSFAVYKENNEFVIGIVLPKK